MIRNLHEKIKRGIQEAHRNGAADATQTAILRIRKIKENAEKLNATPEYLAGLQDALNQLHVVRDTAIAAAAQMSFDKTVLIEDFPTPESILRFIDDELRELSRASARTPYVSGKYNGLKAVKDWLLTHE